MSELKTTTTTTKTSESNYRLPSDITLKHACKLSIVEDKPIMLEYWTASLDKKALVGAKTTGEKLLVKSSFSNWYFIVPFSFKSKFKPETNKLWFTDGSLMFQSRLNSIVNNLSIVLKLL